MTRDEEALKLLLDTAGIRVIKKSESKLMRFIGFFSKKFMTEWWTTYRVPFGAATITYPDDIDNPYRYRNVIMHEVVHCNQFKPWYGPIWMLLLETVIPLPVLFSGRWFVERQAYLRDILTGCSHIEESVDTLWGSYGWVWPKPLMRRWLERKFKEHDRPPF